MSEQILVFLCENVLCMCISWYTIKYLDIKVVKNCTIHTVVVGTTLVG